MLIFTKFKSSLFQGPALGNCFRSFKWIARKSFLRRVPGVHKQDGIGIQINTLQTQGIEITLIHMLFQDKTLKHRWTKVLSIPCVCRASVWKRTWKTFAMRCNLSKITSENLFLLHFIWENFQNYPNSSFSQNASG